MSPSIRYAKKPAKARQRRLLQAHERLERDRRQAQRVIEALEQALHDLGLPENLGPGSGMTRCSRSMGHSDSWSAGGGAASTQVLSDIDGLLLLVVVGDGRLVVPVDCAMRRPDPGGPGTPCWDKLIWKRVTLAERLAAFGRRGMALPAPMGVADSWLGNSKRMQHVRDAH
jgi:hypothetical protein